MENEIAPESHPSATPAESPAASAHTDEVWDQVSKGDSASWYLDPLVAAQKREANASLLGPAPETPVGMALKTDSFEEAYGDDSTLPDLQPHARRWILIDTSAAMVRRAKVRFPDAAQYATIDIRFAGLRSASMDLVFSNSTLDHFHSAADFESAIRELARILKPGGRLVLTLDNSLNPTYWLLRAYSTTRHAPFPLGYCPTPARLEYLLPQAGFEIRQRGCLLHNPRLISTGLFLVLRRLLGSAADGPVTALLRFFSWFDHLPTRRFTACFVTIDATRR